MEIHDEINEDVQHGKDEEAKQRVLMQLENKTLEAKHFLKYRCGYVVITEKDWKRFKNHVLIYVTLMIVCAFVAGFSFCKAITVGCG
jgi:hypothetical protein